MAANVALQWGLANRVVPKGEARNAAEALAREIARFPQLCMRGDRASVYEQFDKNFAAAMANEFAHGMETLKSGDKTLLSET